jgi:hypothetical protein
MSAQHQRLAAKEGVDLVYLSADQFSAEDELCNVML